MKKEEIIESILKLNAKAETDGLSAKELSTMLEGLTPKKAPYEVAPGASITCKIGIITAGAEVTPAIVGGKDVLEALIERKLVVSDK